MQKNKDGPLGKAPGGSLSRRQMLAGAAVAVIASRIPSAVASTTVSRGQRSARSMPTETPIVRYMAASAVLADGRVLVVGGYDRPWTSGAPATPLASAVIYDPGSGTWSSVGSLKVPRARHAAVTLSDGRVVVLGGVHTRPTASVEVFDPATGKWTSGGEMALPRYDHMAETDGYSIFVMGGSAQGMMSGVETFMLGAQLDE